MMEYFSYPLMTGLMYQSRKFHSYLSLNCLQTHWNSFAQEILVKVIIYAFLSWKISSKMFWMRYLLIALDALYVQISKDKNATSLLCTIHYFYILPSCHLLFVFSPTWAVLKHFIHPHVSCIFKSLTTAAVWMFHPDVHYDARTSYEHSFS